MKYYFRSACMLLIFSFFSCNNKKADLPVKKEPTGDADKTYIYKFTDSSLPPQYHRSYVILVTKGWVFFTVDSYGEVLLKDSIALAETSYKEFSASIDKLDIRNKKEDPGEGCTGNTTDEFEFYTGTSKQVKGYTSLCQDERYGNLEGDFETAKSLFRAIVPDFSNKIESTRKED
jgi:hypothetical protein